MRRRKYYSLTLSFFNSFILSLFTILHSTAGTTDSCKLIISIQIQASSVALDKIGNIYIISGDKLLKYNKEGELLSSFSDKKRGPLQSVDPMNPMKICLFYREYAEVVLLDDKLSLIGEVMLKDCGIQQPMLMCASYNDGVWIYDQQDFMMKRIEGGKKVMLESESFLRLTGWKEDPNSKDANKLTPFLMELHPQKMTEIDRSIYIHDPTYGILIFDQSGSFLRNINMDSISCYDKVNDILVYFIKNTMWQLNIKSSFKNNVTFSNLDGEVSACILSPDFLLAVVKKDRVYLYGK